MSAIGVKLVYEGAKFRLAALLRDGKCDFDVFLAECRKTDLAGYEKLKRRIMVVCEQGLLRNEEQFRCLDGADKIYEFKSNAFRLLCFFDAEQLVVCTHGFVKKKQKTPPGEIGRAARLRREFLEFKKSNRLHREGF